MQSKKSRFWGGVRGQIGDLGGIDLLRHSDDGAGVSL